MANAELTMKIRKALRGLSPDDDAVWTENGLPQITAVWPIVGQRLTRAQITDAAPDFNRSNPVLPEDGSAEPDPSPSDQEVPGESPKSAAEEARQATYHDKDPAQATEPPSKSAMLQDPNSEDAKNSDQRPDMTDEEAAAQKEIESKQNVDARSAFTPEEKAKLAADLGKQIDKSNDEIEKLRSRIHQAQNDLHRMENDRDAMIARREAHLPKQQSRTMNDIQDYLASQQRVRAEREAQYFADNPGARRARSPLDESLRNRPRPARS